MKYNYFGMTTKAWSDRHPAAALDRPASAVIDHPLAFVTIDKPSQNEVDGGFLMVVRVSTSAGRDLLPPAFVSIDKQSLTFDRSSAVVVSLGWKYDRNTDWRAIASNAIRQRAKDAIASGIPQNCVKEWYE